MTNSVPFVFATAILFPLCVMAQVSTATLQAR
jgi:hypothetical protein